MASSAGSEGPSPAPHAPGRQRTIVHLDMVGVADTRRPAHCCPAGQVVWSCCGSAALLSLTSSALVFRENRAWAFFLSCLQDCFFAAVAEAENPVFKGKPLVRTTCAAPGCLEAHRQTEALHCIPSQIGFPLV